MSKNKATEIICFTSSYPYGGKETYFGNELEYLAKEFDIVHIFPTYNSTGSEVQREVPQNVKVYPTFIANGFKRVYQGIFNTSPGWTFIKDFFFKKPYKKRAALKRWFNALLIFRVKYYKVKTLSKNWKEGTIVYAYWGGEGVFATDICKKYKKVMRMHGGDFYLNRNDGYIPLVERIYNKTDLLLPISNDISAILQSYYHVPPEKIFVNYLGVRKLKPSLSVRDDNVIRVVSCSNLVDLKRVNIIAQLVANWQHNISVEWHHFGDGPEANTLKKMIADYSGNNKMILHGWTNQQDIYQFYSTTYVHWFLNVSIYEGIPVSIMEAFSFGIPAIATNAGATAEIVNNNNGYLIDVEIEYTILKKMILSIAEEGYEQKRKAAFHTWNTTFNADKNYAGLIDRLNMLYKETGPDYIQ